MAQSTQNPSESTSQKTFDEWYQEIPPWDIGRPQTAFVNLEAEGKLKGKILDVGCGTGENALFLSSKNHDVWGVDFSPLAIKKAQQKAQDRNLRVTFTVADALKLGDLNQPFDCVIDSGLFHCFSDDDRPLFVNQVSKILTLHGVYHFLCFSEKELREGGPRRISLKDIETSFNLGWKQLSVKEVIFENTLHLNGSQAYLVSLEKVPY